MASVDAVVWRRPRFHSLGHMVGWAEEQLRQRPNNRRRALELVLDAAWRDGVAWERERRDRELVTVLGIGCDPDPGGYAPWDPPRERVTVEPSSPARDALRDVLRRHNAAGEEPED